MCRRNERAWPERACQEDTRCVEARVRIHDFKKEWNMRKAFFGLRAVRTLQTSHRITYNELIII